jgi:DNA-binding NarL/FixJ family response regulator
MHSKKKIIIADDHPLLIDGLSAVINNDNELMVCATAASGRQLLQIIPLYEPDLIMLDINLPGMDGIDTAKLIKTGYHQIPVLCISSYYSDTLIATLKSISVEGFVPKQTDSKMVLQVVKQMIAGKRNIFLKSEFENHYNKSAVKELELLTQREKEIIRLIKNGKSTKEIAEFLFLSVHTVDTHRKNICAKLNLENPSSLVRYAANITI